MPNRRQVVIWINADPIHWRIYAALGRDELIGPMGTNFSEILIEIYTFSLKKIHMKKYQNIVGKTATFCLGLLVLSNSTKQGKENWLQSVKLPCRLSVDNVNRMHSFFSTNVREMRPLSLNISYFNLSLINHHSLNTALPFNKRLSILWIHCEVMAWKG